MSLQPAAPARQHAILGAFSTGVPAPAPLRPASSSSGQTLWLFHLLLLLVSAVWAEATRGPRHCQGASQPGLLVVGSSGTDPALLLLLLVLLVVKHLRAQPGLPGRMALPTQAVVRAVVLVVLVATASSES